MSQADSVTNLTSLGCTVTEPKRYTLIELFTMENKQGMYSTTDDSVHYYLDNKLHRTDGPAVEFAQGSKLYYLNDELHRTDGPALDFAYGSKGWFINGKLHRTDGPAAEHADGSKEWYVNGKKLSEQEFSLYF